MFVKCIKEPPGTEGTGILGQPFLVLTLQFPRLTSPRIFIRSLEDGTPDAYDLSCFEIIDSSIPPDWMCEPSGNGYYYILPKEFMGDFWSDFVDGNRNAEETFTHVLEKLVMFHGPSCAPCLRRYDDKGISDVLEDFEFLLKRRLCWLSEEELEPNPIRDILLTHWDPLNLKKPSNAYDLYLDDLEKIVRQEEAPIKIYEYLLWKEIQDIKIEADVERLYKVVEAFRRRFNLYP